MGEERRAYKRHDIRCQARIKVPGLGQRDCVISDVCAGGIYIALADHDSDTAWLKHRGVVEVVPQPAGTAVPSSLRGRAVRATSEGLGVCFPRPMPDVPAALVAAATPPEADAPSTAAASTKPATSRLAREILSLLRHESEQFARSAVAEFATHMVDELFENARSGATGADQNSYYAAFRALRSHRYGLEDSYVPHLLQRVDRITETRCQETSQLPNKPANESGDLSLVDERHFDDWLSRSELITRTQRQIAHLSGPLNRRLRYVTGQMINDETNPIGPTVLCELLPQVLPLHQLEGRPAHTVYDVFGRVVLVRLEPLYQRLNEIMRARRILPDIENERWEVRNPDSEVSAAQTGTPAPEAHYTATSNDGMESTTAPRSPASAIPATSASPQQSRQTTTAVGPRSEPRSAAAALPADNATATSPITNAGAGTDPTQCNRLLPTAAQALQMYRQAKRPSLAGAATASTASPSVADPPAAQRSAADPKVLAAAEYAAVESLSECQHEHDRDYHQGIAQRFVEGLGADDLGELSADTRDTVELVDDYFGDIERNTLNTSFLRDWSGRIGLHALKAELQRGEFLQAEAQPIHDLIDQLDHAGVALGTLSATQHSELRTRLDAILHHALAEAGGEPEALRQASEEVAELITQPLRTRAANMQRVLQQCEGQHKLEQARRVVDDELDKRIAERSIPRLLYEFIYSGWRELLALVWLRHRDATDEWRHGLETLDQLVFALGSDASPARPIPDPEGTFAFATSQLNGYSRMTWELQKILGDIHKYVQQVCRDGYGAEALEMVQVPERVNDNSEALKQVESRWLGEAKLLTAGDWVFFAGGSGQPEPLRLQWVGDEHDRFVFVDRSGRKARDLGLIELAQLLQAAHAGVSEDFDAPLSERQWRKRLQHLHEEMLQRAKHDALTGLLNRSSFLQELEHSPAPGSHKGRRHALVYCSLDGFAVVNSTRGNQAGDALLYQIGRQLSDAAAGHGFVGRLSGDEFAVHLADTNDAAAELFAEQRCTAIHTADFEHNGETLSISASLGALTYYDGEKRPSELLRDANEACLAAKRAGGNRVHLVVDDDEGLQEIRGGMVSAARVDAALKAGALSLRCQRIEPVDRDEGLGAFYEVLTSIRGPDNTEIPPDEFIPAAERFGRMGAVDRQVVSDVLEWAAANSAAMSAIGGFFVNLSGPTLNDPKFSAYLRAQLARTGIDGSRICFEITETAAVQNLAQAADLINEVKSFGCRFSLDDFGTGLSSYAYLKNLPIDYLKIDGQFVRDIDTDPADHAMVRSINELGHFLGKRTVGEYVENQAALSQLREIGVDYAQGYAVARPVPLNDMASVD